jgi:hypothetical protein
MGGGVPVARGGVMPQRCRHLRLPLRAAVASRPPGCSIPALQGQTGEATDDRRRQLMLGTRPPVL